MDETGSPPTPHPSGHVVQGGATFLEALDLAIDHDPEQVIADLVDQVRGLEMRLHGGRVGAALGPEILERMRAMAASVVERAQAPFRAAVIGEFNRGKSTLVNALVGERVAPMDPLPETITINSFSHGDAFSAEMRLRGGGKIALRRDHLPRASLLAVIEAAPSEPLGLDIRMPAAILKDVVLVDMPGSGDMGADIRREVRQQIGASDVLIVVVSALAPMSEAERHLLRSTVRPHNFPQILFVLNMIDTVDTDADAQRVRAHVQRELGAQFPGMRLYAVSALDELARLTQARRPDSTRADRLVASFAEFQGDLVALVAEQRRAIRADRVANTCADGLADIEIRLRLLARSLTKESEDIDRDLAQEQRAETRLEEELARRRAALSGGIETLAAEAQDWMRGFAARLSDALATQLVGLSRSDIERDLQFFVADAVQAALGACFEAHAQALAQLSRQLLDETAALEAVALGASVRSASASVYSGAQWSVTVLVRMALDHALGLGLAVDLLAGLLSVATPGADAMQWLQDLRRAAPRLGEAFARAARESYAAVETDLATRLEKVYVARRLALGEATRQAAHVHRAQAADLATARLGVEEALAWVAQTSTALQALRAVALPR